LREELMATVEKAVKRCGFRAVFFTVEMVLCLDATRTELELFVRKIQN
jgi:hypothetical protein